MTTSIPPEEYGDLMLGDVDLSRAIQIIAANAIKNGILQDRIQNNWTYDQLCERESGARFHVRFRIICRVEKILPDAPAEH